MLSGFAQVTDEGKYLRPPHAKLSYGGVSCKSPTLHLRRIILTFNLDVVYSSKVGTI